MIADVGMIAAKIDGDLQIPNAGVIQIERSR